MQYRVALRFNVLAWTLQVLSNCRVSRLWYEKGTLDQQATTVTPKTAHLIDMLYVTWLEVLLQYLLEAV